MLDHSRGPNRSEMPRTVSADQVHELKNRLTVLKGIAQLLARQVRRPELDRDRLEERVASLQNEVARLELLINDIARRDDGALVQQTRATQMSAYAED